MHGIQFFFHININFSVCFSKNRLSYAFLWMNSETRAEYHGYFSNQPRGYKWSWFAFVVHGEAVSVEVVVDFTSIVSHFDE